MSDLVAEKVRREEVSAPPPSSGDPGQAAAEDNIGSTPHKIAEIDESQLPALFLVRLSLLPKRLLLARVVRDRKSGGREPRSEGGEEQPSSEERADDGCSSSSAAERSEEVLAALPSEAKHEDEFSESAILRKHRELLGIGQIADAAPRGGPDDVPPSVRRRRSSSFNLAGGPLAQRKGTFVLPLALRRFGFAYSLRLELLSNAFMILSEHKNVSTLLEVFRFLDTDKDGVLSQQDVKTALTQSKTEKGEYLFRGVRANSGGIPGGLLRTEVDEICAMVVRASVARTAGPVLPNPSADGGGFFGGGKIPWNEIAELAPGPVREVAVVGATQQTRLQANVCAQSEFREMFHYVNSWHQLCGVSNGKMFLQAVRPLIQRWVWEKRAEFSGCALGEIKVARKQVRSGDLVLTKIVELIGNHRILYEAVVGFLQRGTVAATIIPEAANEQRNARKEEEETTAGHFGAPFLGDKTAPPARRGHKPAEQTPKIEFPFEPVLESCGDREPYLSSLRNALFMSLCDRGVLKPSIAGRWTLDVAWSDTDWFIVEHASALKKPTDLRQLNVVLDHTGCGNAEWRTTTSRKNLPAKQVGGAKQVPENVNQERFEVKGWAGSGRYGKDDQNTEFSSYGFLSLCELLSVGM